ncbi:hypothetical protein NHX12_009328 [Muraenolepis orangiensis]|uniref:Uncharacterized protein n=1 Tax=Muraenolepis orangiensis TaxID=630683 RepID=A0A9Q0DN58_9TELE|nr:hypothetical protein NHX12_009328 [Muraenolepis orangiensis]
MPILLDMSSVPRGQMLPLSQEEQRSFGSSFQSVENNWMTPPPPPPPPPPRAIPSPAFPSTSRPRPVFNPGTPSSSSTLRAESVGGNAVRLQVVGGPAPPNVAGGQQMVTATAVNAVWNPQDQTIVLSFSLPPVIGDVRAAAAARAPLLPLEPSVELERENAAAAAVVVGPATAPSPPRAAPIQQMGFSASPIGADVRDTPSPYWLDLLLENSDSM